MHLCFKLSAIAAAVLAIAGCSSGKKLAYNPQTGFPVIDQKGQTAIVAHRGFWKSEAGGMSENSIASLRAAQDAGLWGSECDVHITADDVIIVNHDPAIEGKKISTSTFAELSGFLLPNGERRPTLDEYLDQAAKSKTTKLVIELKKQPSEDREDLLVAKTIAALKVHKLYDPNRVLFISFSKYMCDVVARLCPEFINQFLSMDFVGNHDPDVYGPQGINGVDYHYKMFQMHPNWVKHAHDRGMSVNAWTVNKEDDIKKMIELGVDAITTNEPLLVRRLLGDKEYK